jgi:hypothetical protein
MDVGANYEEAFSQGLAGALGGSELLGKTMKMMGMQLTTKALTAQVWQGSTEVSFSLPLVFQVEKDEHLDLHKPLIDLYKLVLPTESGAGGLLQAPGPVVDLEKLKTKNVDLNIKGIASSTGSLAGSIFSASGTNDVLKSANGVINAAGQGLQSLSKGFVDSIKNNIQLQIGSKCLLKSVVITSVSANTSVLPLQSGTFQRVECTVGFKTFYVLTQEDLPDLIGYSQVVDNRIVATGKQF